MNPVTGLALGRIVIGIVSLVSPELAGKLFRLDTLGNPQLSFLSRMFGSREIALGALTLATSGPAQRTLVLGGIAVDASDAAASYLAGRDGIVTRPTSAFLGLGALAAVAAGVAALAASRK